MTATQRTLPMRIDWRAPVMTLRGVAGAFGSTEEDARFEIEEGRFEWVWNIASVSSEKREFRVFTPSVQSRMNVLAGQPGWNNTEEYVWRKLFPRRNRKPFITASEFSEGLQCTRPHTIEIAREQELVLDGTYIKAVRGHETLLDWDCVQTFLRDVRVTADNPEGRCLRTPRKTE